MLRIHLISWAKLTHSPILYLLLFLFENELSLTFLLLDCAFFPFWKLSEGIRCQMFIGREQHNNKVY